MSYYTSDSHDMVCIHCNKIITCENPDCYLPHMHEGICDDCLYYEEHGIFDDINIYEEFGRIV
uniref:Uncharacterized protein n=1 Tax=viral metagenome TaxID=1070528 RepID=A0A6H1ZR21_9ZZZZ